jgi:hypothetical protein
MWPLGHGVQSLLPHYRLQSDLVYALRIRSFFLSSRFHITHAPSCLYQQHLSTLSSFTIYLIEAVSRLHTDSDVAELAAVRHDRLQLPYEEAARRGLAQGRATLYELIIS